MAEPTPEDVELVARALADGYRNDPLVIRARPVLAALAEAGRLTPPDATEQFGVGEPGRRVMPYTTEVVARSKAKELRLPLFRRWVGPWQPVDTPNPQDHDMEKS